MKISWNCLNQLIDLKKTNVLETANKLTLAGFEVEKITPIDTIEDTILEISITANRQDIIGFIHIATELSALFQTSLNINNQLNNTKDNIKTLKFSSNNKLNLFQDLCICIIKNIPIDLQNQPIINLLTCLDIKTTGSFLDIINLINLKWGQNILVYKLANDNTEKIDKYIFDFNNNKNNFHNLPLQIYIENEALIKIDSENIHNYKNISNILLVNYNSADNNQIKHHQTNICFNYCLNAYQDIFNIFKTLHYDIIIPKKIYKYSKSYSKQHQIICNINKIHKILGPINKNETTKEFKDNTIINLLQYLNFNIKKQNNQLYIEVPKNRKNDIGNPIDIIEEIGRVYGFNYFKDKIPKFNNIQQISKITHFKQKIRRVLRSIGMHEIITYSLQQQDKNLKILNPLSQEQENLRSNLISNLITSKLYNTNQDNADFEAFEIGTVFIKNTKNQKYDEALHLSCLLGKLNFNQSTWKEQIYPLTWFQVKGQLEEVFEKIYAQISWSTQQGKNNCTPSLIPYIHPTRSIYIISNNKTIGVLSQLNNRISKTIGSIHKIYFFEINLHELATTTKSYNHLTHTYVPYSSYPKINRDFSITVNNKISMEYINKLIHKIKVTQNNMIESIRVLSEYYTNNTLRTICLRITYRSESKTLTHKEVEILDDMFKTKINLAIESKT